MFKAIKEFFVGKPVETTPAVPYKVEVVETPKVEALPAGIEAVVVTPAAVVPVLAMGTTVEDVSVAVVAAPEAPAKAPRKPRAPKAPAAEKTAAKKAAPVKKAAVKKPAARSVVKSKKV
jgi:hypothetical protein